MVYKKILGAKTPDYMNETQHFYSLQIVYIFCKLVAFYLT